MIKAILGKLFHQENLDSDNMRQVMTSIAEGECSPAQIGAFLTAMAIKGETVEEIAAAVLVLRERSILVPAKAEHLTDTCGTGGDKSGTFNISTVSAIVAAAAGVPIAKHGNRAMSSQCGSANVLQHLGISTELKPEDVAECIDTVGIGFLFAPALHPAMKNVAGPRAEIGQRTLFNLMGPMLNPARAKNQVMGIYDGRLTRTVAEVLQKTGANQVLVVAGTDGLDELTLTGPSKVAELKDGKINEYILNPEDFALPLCSKESLLGGDAQHNAEIILEILKGGKGPRRDITLLNAGAAIYASQMIDSIQSGIALARKAIDSGAAIELLEQWIKKSQQLSAVKS